MRAKEIGGWGWGGGGAGGYLNKGAYLENHFSDIKAKLETCMNKHQKCIQRLFNSIFSTSLF